MSALPDGLDLAVLGLRPESAPIVSVLRRRPTHAVYRVTGPEGSRILKWFAGAGPFVELTAYDVLAHLGVPTLPVYGRSQNAILVEDLDASPHWRQAVEADHDDPACGRAVAGWYRCLHAAGAGFLAGRDRVQWPFVPWLDLVHADSLGQAATALGLADVPDLWQAIAVLDRLLAIYRRQPQTLNYQDFALENLALSRTASDTRAIVYDYDWFTIGTSASDWRNVMSGLSGPAAAAFAAAYGPLDPAEARLDRPLALLHGLVIAADRPRLPAWARPLLAAVRDGSLAQDIRDALDTR